MNKTWEIELYVLSQNLKLEKKLAAMIFEDKLALISVSFIFLHADQLWFYENIKQY